MMHTKLLFVYGTLRRDTDHPMSHLLQNHSTNQEKAFFNGTLYDVGSYPAAIRSVNKADKVYGELYELLAPDLIINDLDEYEGYYPKRPKDSLYIRKKVLVHILDDGTRTAWTYLYNRSPNNLTRIPNGDYLEYLQLRKHQN